LSENPSTLGGTQLSFQGDGGMHNAIYRSRAFELKPGLVVTKTEHGGIGECYVRLIQSKRVGGGLILVGVEIDLLKWVLVDHDDESPKWAFARVSGRKDDNITAMRPGEYTMEVKSTSEWRCQLVQPAMGQSKGRFPHYVSLEGKGGSVDTFRTGVRPVLANIQHIGTGEFYLGFFSLDGMHQYIPGFSTKVGQLHVKRRLLDLLPNKEYLIYGEGNGKWNLGLTEG
jgi:hypothetical protein